jgi:hypothetical protein
MDFRAYREARETADSNAALDSFHGKSLTTPPRFPMEELGLQDDKYEKSIASWVDIDLILGYPILHDVHVFRSVRQFPHFANRLVH